MQQQVVISDGLWKSDDAEKMFGKYRRLVSKGHPYTRYFDDNMVATKDYKTEYKKIKAKLVLLEDNFTTSQPSNTSQPKKKGIVAETFDWDKEEVSDVDEDVTQVKVLMALTDDELSVGKNHARNGEWIDITMRKINILLSMDEDADWKNYLKYINVDLKFVEEHRLNLLSKYNKIVFELNKCRDDLLVLKQAKLDDITFQIKSTELTKIIVPESQAINECLKPTKASNDPESSKDFESKSLTPLPLLKNLQGASPSFEVLSLTYQDHSLKERSGLEVKSENYKAQPYQYASPSKQILKAKAKPFPPCTHYGFNDHKPDDCRNYPKCKICGSYDHFTSGHNRVILVRGGALVESSQFSETSIGARCNTCGSTIHSTIDHNDFDHFKKETHQGSHLVRGQWMLKDYDWCQELSAQICRVTRS
ncbi:hypothetical protein Tco_0414854 [Tanacetum coccineum]